MDRPVRRRAASAHRELADRPGRVGAGAAGRRRRPGLPVLGICRGMQVMAVHGGGSLEQHLPDAVGHETHSPGGDEFGNTDVETCPGTRVRMLVGDGSTSPATTTRASASTRLRARCYADDGTLEAMEAAGDRFRLAVQCTPRPGRTPACSPGSSPRRRRLPCGEGRVRRGRSAWSSRTHAGARGSTGSRTALGSNNAMPTQYLLIRTGRSPRPRKHVIARLPPVALLLSSRITSRTGVQTVLVEADQVDVARHAAPAPSVDQRGSGVPRDQTRRQVGGGHAVPVAVSPPRTGSRPR